MFIATSGFAGDKTIGYFERVNRTIPINFKSYIDACKKTYKSGSCTIPNQIKIKTDEKIKDIKIGSQLTGIQIENDGNTYSAKLIWNSKEDCRIIFDKSFYRASVFETDSDIAHEVPNSVFVDQLLKELITKPISFIIEKPFIPTF